MRSATLFEYGPKTQMMLLRVRKNLHGVWCRNSNAWIWLAALNPYADVP
jgi:hypothetical protein